MTSERFFIRRILVSSIFMILLTSPLIMTVNATNDNSIDSEFLIRKLIREYVNAMNKRSTGNIVSLFNEEGQFIDETFNQEFSGVRELTNLYCNIFSINNRLLLLFLGK